jgi:hypothetical protein
VTFADLLLKYRRVAIVGGPKTGKTTHFAAMVTDREIIHTDDWKQLPWEVVPELAIAKAKPFAEFVIEGVQVARALRKGLEVDAVFLTTKPKAPRKPGHVSMTKAVMTVFREWRHAHPDVPLLIE